MEPSTFEADVELIAKHCRTVMTELDVTGDYRYRADYRLDAAKLLWQVSAAMESIRVHGWAEDEDAG